MEELAGPEGCVLRNLLAVAEFYDPEHASFETISPLEERASLATLTALLILAYPEVHWALWTPYRPPGRSLSHFHFISLAEGLRGVVRAQFAGYVPLFDPAGLREGLRSGIWQALGLGRITSDGARFPQRQRVAAVVDEEAAYAYFNSLVAFRCGYRAWPIMSFRCAEMASNIAAGEAGSSGSEEFALLFEDVYLNFPDRAQSFQWDTKAIGLEDEQRRLSSLEFRDRRLPGLEPGHKRVAVTIGPGRMPRARKLWLENRRYLRGKSYSAPELRKPIAGMYRLLRQADMWDRRRGRAELADGFNWPPALREGPSGELPSHSTPGRLLMVAQRLLSRSNRILAQCRSVPDAVHAAVLAIEAKELLCNLTPTTAFEALALQHEAEAVAESLFLGVQYNLDLRDRLREVRYEIESICERLDPRGFPRSTINAELAIVEGLAKRFRELNQVEEELACLAKARKLRFQFWARESLWRWPLWHLVLKPIAFGLSSVPRFLAVVAAVIGGFAFLYWGTAALAGRSDLARPLPSLAASAYFTFTLQPAECWASLFPPGSTAAWWWHLLLAFHGAVSFANLGILVSHLYMIVSRR
ncbi:MAG: hypothetical protein ACOYX1_02510 [Acidobacteriota bacterium]